MSENSTTLFTLEGDDVMVIDNYYGYGDSPSQTVFFIKYNPTYLDYIPDQAITQTKFIDRITKFVFGERNDDSNVCTNIITLFSDQKSGGEYKENKCMLKGNSDEYPTVLELLTTLKPSEKFLVDNSLSGTPCMTIENSTTLFTLEGDDVMVIDNYYGYGDSPSQDENHENKVLIPHDISAWPDENYDILYDVWKSVIRVDFGDASNVIYNDDITNLRANFVSGNISFSSENIPLVGGETYISTDGEYNLVINKQSGVRFTAYFSNISFNSSLFKVDEDFGRYYFTILTNDGKKWRGELSGADGYISPSFNEIYDSEGSNYCSYDDFLKISNVSLQIPIIYKGPFLDITLVGYTNSDYVPSFLKNWSWSFIFKNNAYGDLYYPWSRNTNSETTPKRTTITPYYASSSLRGSHTQIRYLKQDIISNVNQGLDGQILIPCVRQSVGDIFYIGLKDNTWGTYATNRKETISDLTGFSKLEIYRCTKWKLSGNLRNINVTIGGFDFNTTGIYEIPLSQTFIIQCQDYIDIYSNDWNISDSGSDYYEVTIPDSWVNDYVPEININVN